ncbi:hypothetical protein [Undibacterium oligocarboniphilum]|uniref:Uncharacterized protein n=1 Tax=Undibacterium oligocarboniphilum TaxID=666702 RepID=A0A850QRC7_9BURK|nr:hypothetical protein [Undibacterium oligocarboniphilum]MBC3871724.1 hypothetical protein [Undibacterium oligocarboniphilum]NVO79360.1 hypothetical protein [Undibacterium oligocarboniphilum]
MFGQKQLDEFMTALNGGRGDLDAWLEANDEAEVRTAVKAVIHVTKTQCANACLDIALKHQQTMATHGTGKSDGAKECAETILPSPFTQPT